MKINSLSLGDVVTDGTGRYAIVSKCQDAPHDLFYANIEPEFLQPDERDAAPIVDDFFVEYVI